MCRSKRLLLALASLAVCVAQAQFPFFGGGHREPMPEISGSVRLEPADAVVGTPCHFVFSFKGGSSVSIQRVAGLPDGGIEYLANELEPYADNTYRLPVRFLEPNTNTLEIAVSGMQTVERGRNSAFHSSFSTSFQKRLPALRLNVQPLPTGGRPASFAGAVGTRFTMSQKLVPDHVRPGDLVTATYELVYDGYCPSNAWPRIENLPKEFKAYEPKEIARGTNSFTWTQVLVPRTTAATNSALVSLSYYNPRTRRYEYARAFPKKLVFVSDKAASTENTAVVIASQDTQMASAADRTGQAGSAPIVLRFAPSDGSPVIATLPPGSPVRELAKANGWRRLESPRAVGWSR